MGALSRRPGPGRDRRVLHARRRRGRRLCVACPTPAASAGDRGRVAAIRWLGFVPAELDNAPAAGVQRLAGQLDVDLEELAAYAPSERTAREHRQRATDLAHFRDPVRTTSTTSRSLLVEHALEHDSPLALLRTTAITLRNRQLLRPAISTLERPVASARARAERDTYARLEPLLDAQTRRALDALCVTDMRLGVSRLVWLGREARSASPAQIVAQLEKLAFLRQLGAPESQLDAVSANRRRQLAALARRSTTAALAGRPDRLCYPALLCFCHDQAVRLLDEILDRADQAVGEAHGQALRELRSSRRRQRPRPTRRSPCSTCSWGCCLTTASPTTRSASARGKRWLRSTGRRHASRPRRSCDRWMTTTTRSSMAATRTCGVSSPR